MGFFSVNLSYLPLETFSTYSILQPGAPWLDCPHQRLHKEPPLLACFKPASHSFLMMLPSSEGETQPLSHCTHGCHFSHFFSRVRDLVFSGASQCGGGHEASPTSLLMWLLLGRDWQAKSLNPSPQCHVFSFQMKRRS